MQMPIFTIYSYGNKMRFCPTLYIMPQHFKKHHNHYASLKIYNRFSNIIKSVISQRNFKKFLIEYLMIAVINMLQTLWGFKPLFPIHFFLMAQFQVHLFPFICLLCLILIFCIDSEMCFCLLFL